jgi:fatty-acyl-CoA synthase
MSANLSYAAGSTDKPLLQSTIGDNFDRAVAQFPSREALIDVPTARRWTYAELRADVDALASALLDGGITRGGPRRDLVAELPRVGHGAVRHRQDRRHPRHPHELAYALNQSGIRLLFAAPSFKSSDYAAMVEEVTPRSPALDRTVYFGNTEWTSLLARGRLLGPQRLADAQAALTPHDPINIQYTSGTTGFPKGATLSHHNILNNGYFVGYTHEDRICVPVPFYHCFGMVMSNLGATSHGAYVVIPSPGFDPVATLKACSAERCTSVYGVPTMFIAMLAVPDFDTYGPVGVRTAIMAGSPCPVEVMKQVIQWAPDVAIAYGMTETSPASTQTRAGDTLDRRVSTVGRVHPHVQVKVVDPETGETKPRGQTGELCTGGYSVMLGYWDDPEKTDEAVDAEGWIHTGDLAVTDTDGYLSITGRIKDLVIRGGENIYPLQARRPGPGCRARRPPATPSWLCRSATAARPATS